MGSVSRAARGQRTIHAPQVPGTTPGKPEAIREVDDLWDLVLVYEEAIRALGLERPAVIGQSFGGMLACELAATFPALFSRIVLLDPIGLWLDEHPVANWVAAAPEELPALLFHDPGCEAARAAMTPPADPDAALLRSPASRGRSAARRSSSGRSPRRVSRSGCTGSRHRR